MEANASALWPTGPGPAPTSAPPDPSSVVDLVKVISNAVILGGGSLGNGLVIWLTARQAARSVNCVWFLNLAVADFLFSVSRAVPLARHALYHGHWPFSTFLCRANSFAKYLNMFCSVFLLAAISLDRLAAVAFPVWSKNRRGPRLAWAAAAAAWGAATVASLPFYLYRSLAGSKCSMTAKGATKVILYLLRLLCGFLAPFAIIASCYGALAVVLRRRQVNLHSRKPLKVMVAIVVTFFLCWAPYHLFLLLKLANVKGRAMAVGLPLTSTLAYLNSCANPVLYFFMGLDFRRVLGRTTLTRAFRRALLDDMASSARAHGRKQGATSSADGMAQSSEVPDLA